MDLNKADAPAVVPPAVAAQPVVRRARISDTDKERLIAAFNGNADYLELARNLGINRSSAYSIVRRSQEPAPVNNWGGRRGSKVDQEMIDVMVDTVETHSTYTLNQINAELRLRLPQKPHVCIATLANELKSPCNEEAMRRTCRKKQPKDEKCETRLWSMALAKQSAA